MSDNKQQKVAYSITRRGEKSYFNRIGTAFVNKDGSLNVILFANPVNGELHIRDPKPKEVTEATAA